MIDIEARSLPHNMLTTEKKTPPPPSLFGPNHCLSLRLIFPIRNNEMQTSKTNLLMIYMYIPIRKRKGRSDHLIDSNPATLSKKSARPSAKPLYYRRHKFRLPH